MSAVPTTLRVARLAARRAWLADSARLTGRGLLWGAAGGLLAVAVNKVFADRIGPHWVWSVPLAAGAAGGLVFAWMRRWSNLRAAQELDHRLGLKDRLSSAMAMRTSGPFESWSVQEAERAAAVAKISNAVPLRAEWTWGTWPVLLAAAIAGAVFLPRLTWSLPGPSPSNSSAARQTAAEQVRQLAQALRKQDAAAPQIPASPEQIRQLEKLEQELVKGNIDPDKARAEAARDLGNLAQKAESDAKIEQSASDQAKDQLARAAADKSKSGAGESGELASALEESLKRGDLDTAADIAQEAADKASTMSEQDLKNLARDLDELAESIERQEAEQKAKAAAEAAKPGPAPTGPDAGTPPDPAAPNQVKPDQPKADPPKPDTQPTGDAKPAEHPEQPQADKPPSPDKGEEKARDRTEQMLRDLRESVRDAARDLRGEKPPEPKPEQKPDSPRKEQQRDQSKPATGDNSKPSGDRQQDRQPQSQPSGSQGSKQGQNQPSPDSRGPTPTGPQGASGSSGQQNSQPRPGSKPGTGATPQGAPSGQPGASGTTGASGSSGQQGPTGPSGSTGSQGSTGSSGNTSAQGQEGAGGTTGSPGASGQQRPTGASGSSGAQGPTGPTGNTPTQGQEGASGSTGSTGASGQPSGSGPTKSPDQQPRPSPSGSPSPQPSGQPGSSGTQPGGTGQQVPQAVPTGSGPTGPTGAAPHPQGGAGPTGQQPAPTGGRGSSRSSGGATPTGPQGATGAAAPSGQSGSTGGSGTTGPGGATGPSQPQSNPDEPAGDGDPRGNAPETNKGPGQSMQKLAEKLRNIPDAAKRAQQMMQQSQNARDAARRMAEQATPEQQEQLRKFMEGLNKNKKPGAGAGDQRAESRPNTPTSPRDTATQPVDARSHKPAPQPNERVLAEYYSDRPYDRKPGEAVAGPISEEFKKAADAIERGSEQQPVPPKYSELVKRVFKRYAEQTAPPEPPKK